ncbi:MAG: hypothetical protein AB1349_12170 [Elusimicrobiota bacterium]
MNPNLYCVIKTYLYQKETYFTTVRNIRINEKNVSPSEIRQWNESEFGNIEINWYKVKIIYTDKSGKKQVLATPGKESVDYCGITQKVHRIDFRKDNTYLGWLSSYYNVPGVFGSVDSQDNEYTGIDCADLVVAGYRKYSNKNIPLFQLILQE